MQSNASRIKSFKPQREDREDHNESRQARAPRDGCNRMPDEYNRARSLREEAAAPFQGRNYATR